MKHMKSYILGLATGTLLIPIAEELLWFIKGDTNIKYLVDRNVKIWNEWPYEAFKKSEGTLSGVEHLVLQRLFVR